MSKEIRKDLTMAFCQMFPNPNSSTRDNPHHTSLVFFLDVAAAAPAVARAGAAGVVAVTRSVDFALDDDTVVAVVAVHKEGQDGCDEEEDDVHDSKRPRGLEHGALAVGVDAESSTTDGEKTQVGAVRTTSTPVGAVSIGNAAQSVDGSDEGAHEEKVDKGNEFGRVLCARVEEEGA